MAMNEDYVDYQTALALKKCGFDEPCRCCYIADKNTESNAEFTEYASRGYKTSVCELKPKDKEWRGCFYSTLHSRKACDMFEKK